MLCPPLQKGKKEPRKVHNTAIEEMAIAMQDSLVCKAYALKPIKPLAKVAAYIHQLFTKTMNGPTVRQSKSWLLVS